MLVLGNRPQSYEGDDPVDYLNDWNGHDALIESIVVNVREKSVSVRLLAYPDENSKDRKPIELIFADVESVTTSTNLDQMEANSFAGTVNHWHLAEGPGSSFFYLIEGYIAVKAHSTLKLEERPPASLPST
jgi:hypothetical protein